MYRSKSMCVGASPSIEERLQMNTNNKDFIAVFKNITGLDTESCKSDEIMSKLHLKIVFVLSILLHSGALPAVE